MSKSKLINFKLILKYFIFIGIEENYRINFRMPLVPLIH